MYRIEEAAIVVKQLNLFRKSKIKDFEFIKVVCNYFDKIKSEDIRESDLKFLKYISSMSGIPHFYDILGNRFGHNTEIEDVNLSTLASYIYDSTLHTDNDTKLHKFQKEILDRFEEGELNRFFLSASTSFGKTHIVFEIIKKMKYQNVLLVFPTIALLSENLDKILSDDIYSYFGDKYNVHTLSEVSDVEGENIFIYTPERYLSFIEKNNDVKMNFVFVDEIYKMDNDYLIDEHVRENERDVAYRLAVHYALDNKVDVLLAGPYIEFSKKEDRSYNNSFDNFLNHNSIKLLDYNDYEIVNKSYKTLKSSNKLDFPGEIKFKFSKGANKAKRLICIIEKIVEKSENTIVYCNNRGKAGGVEGYAQKVVESGIFSNHDYSKYKDLIEHISTNFSPKWILVKALKHGIGIHHGLIPKYIQKEIISLFNDSLIRVLISTTTITEGVNTSAKNMIVMQAKKGNKDLKKFDAKNIAGRAGRFGYHYSGRVIIIQNDFEKVINSKGDIIKHKNYDKNSIKDEIDLFSTDEMFLKQEDKDRKKYVLLEQRKRGIPDTVISQYKVVSRADKIKIFDRLEDLSENDYSYVKSLIRSINGSNVRINWDGFQVVLNVILPICNDNIKRLIENKFSTKRGDEYSVIVAIVHAYLNDGFSGSIRYHRDVKKEPIDKAITETSKFVYNTLKYQLVKYLGVFNIMYKYVLSVNENKSIDEISGIDKLLMKFEYNALTDEGRIASDYGVPKNVLDYYEDKYNNSKIKNKFDSYEQRVFEKVEAIINR